MSPAFSLRQQEPQIGYFKKRCRKSSLSLRLRKACCGNSGLALNAKYSSCIVNKILLLSFICPNVTDKYKTKYAGNRATQDAIKWLWNLKKYTEVFVSRCESLHVCKCLTAVADPRGGGAGVRLPPSPWAPMHK